MKTSFRFPWRFLILAYSFSWLFWIPVVLTGQDYQASPVLLAFVFLGVFGPGLAGILMTYVEGGWAGGRDFWARALDVRRVRPGWVLIIFLMWPGFHLAALLINRWLGGAPPEYGFLREMIAQPAQIPVVLFLYFLQAALEDLGWRGYLQERLQKVWTPLAAALVIGIFHAAWHLPLFWMVGTNQINYGFDLDLLIFVLVVTAISIFSTWCYNANNRSTLAVIALHWTGNLCLDLFLLPEPGERIVKILMIVSAGLIAGLWLINDAQAQVKTEIEPIPAGATDF